MLVYEVESVITVLTMHNVGLLLVLKLEKLNNTLLNLSQEKTNAVIREECLHWHP